MSGITPSLWFDDNAEEAINFYLSIFKDSRITQVARYSEAGPGPVGSVMSIAFQLNGQDFIAINGGPHFTFTPAISFTVHCKDQQEVDDFWTKLVDGGQESECGWLVDKYGLSWQIVPTVLYELLSDKDPEKAASVSQALFKMKKIDIQALQDASNQSAVH